MEDRQFPTGANASQRRAIAHETGPAVVLAGPGSGKTFVITERIRYLIERCGIPPSRILTITFTKTAAAQMRRRFLKRTGQRYPEAVFGTFHSVFYRILQLSRDPSDAPLSLVTEAEKRRIMRMLLSDVRAREPSLALSEELIERYLAEIGRIKGAGLWDGGGGDVENTGKPRGDAARSDAVSAAADEASLPDASLPHRELFAGIFHDYARMLLELGKIDFDDILVRCFRLLAGDPAILARWRGHFRHILIDEYQDINRVQYETVRLLAAPGNNLFAVGDDDQSIYGFRGSDPSFMLDFAKDFPGAARYALEVNYRCAPAVLSASARVIEENTRRLEKRIRAGREKEPGEVRLQPFADRERECAAILAFLRKREAEGLLDDTALIVRTNAQAQAIARTLLPSGIACRGAGKRRNFYEETEIADMLAYLRLAGKNPAQEDFYRIMNRPQRYLSRECARGERFSAEEAKRYYRDRPSSLRAIQRFERELRMLGGLRPALAIRFIRTQIGYDRFVRSAGAKGADPEEALRRLDRLQEEAAAFSRTETFLGAVKERAASAGGAEDRRAEERGAQLLTMHAAKGLEFDAVWLPELNEGTIPARRIVTAAQIEEERRLFYVAMTRARRTLVLSWIAGGGNYACAPSRFLRPLMENHSVPF